jgi:hypothetical protein
MSETVDDLLKLWEKKMARYGALSARLEDVVRSEDKVNSVLMKEIWI